MSVLVEADDFTLLAWEYFTHARTNGVRHAEVFFDPQSHTARGVLFKAVLEGYSQTCRRAERELSMSNNLIMSFLRHLPVASAEETLRRAVESRGVANGQISGVGLDSSEVVFPPGLFEKMRQPMQKVCG